MNTKVTYFMWVYI